MILVDTDVLIAHLRGDQRARDWLIAAREREPLVTSVVTVTELIARRAGELMREFRRSHSGIGIADYLIAATSETHGAALATLNTRHFPMFPGLTSPFGD